MSKLGKKAILLPKESTVKVEGDTLLVSGPKGTHKVLFNSKMFSSKINEKNEFKIAPIKKDKNSSAMWGTYRSLINNAILGVTKGHEKNLELNGVGFKVAQQADQLKLKLGFSHCDLGSYTDGLYVFVAITVRFHSISRVLCPEFPLSSPLYGLEISISPTMCPLL